MVICNAVNPVRLGIISIFYNRLHPPMLELDPKSNMRYTVTHPSYCVSRLMVCFCLCFGVQYDTCKAINITSISGYYSITAGFSPILYC